MMPTLALNAAQGMDPMSVGTMIGGILITLLGGGFIGKKISDSRVTLMNNPLDVEVRKAYVTRDECLACKRESNSDVREMKALYDKIITLVMERDERASERTRALGDMLSEKIADLGCQVHDRITQVADESAERRRRIHDKLNEHADLISRVDSRTEVSKSIGRLGSAIMTLAKKQ